MMRCVCSNGCWRSGTTSDFCRKGMTSTPAGFSETSLRRSLTSAWSIPRETCRDPEVRHSKGLRLGARDEEGPPHREAVFAGEQQMHAGGVHPLRRQRTALAGADVPFVAEVHRGPRSPRRRRIVNAESSGEPRVPFGVNLTEQIPLQAWVKTGLRTIGAPRVTEGAAA